MENNDVLGALRAGNRSIEESLEPQRDAFRECLKELLGTNLGELSLNQDLAELLQERADLLRAAFLCPKCEQPARFRCDKNKTSPAGKFTFAHTVGTHTGTAAVPELILVPKPRRKKKEKSE